MLTWLRTICILLLTTILRVKLEISCTRSLNDRHIPSRYRPTSIQLPRKAPLWALSVWLFGGNLYLLPTTNISFSIFIEFHSNYLHACCLWTFSMFNILHTSCQTIILSFFFKMCQTYISPQSNNSYSLSCTQDRNLTSHCLSNTLIICYYCMYH